MWGIKGKQSGFEERLKGKMEKNQVLKLRIKVQKIVEKLLRLK